MQEWIRSGVTLVGFESPGFDPCRDQRYIFKTVAMQLQGVAKIIDLNIDEHRHDAIRLGITSIPTMILFKDGKELRRFIGLQPAEVLLEAIVEAIS